MLSVIYDDYLSHNDAHMNNMMMDRNDTTAESLILIDFDNTQYGYRYTILYDDKVTLYIIY